MGFPLSYRGFVPIATPTNMYGRRDSPLCYPRLYCSGRNVVAFCDLFFGEYRCGGRFFLHSWVSLRVDVRTRIATGLSFLAPEQGISCVYALPEGQSCDKFVPRGRVVVSRGFALIRINALIIKWVFPRGLAGKRRRYAFTRQGPQVRTLYRPPNKSIS